MERRSRRRRRPASSGAIVTGRRSRQLFRNIEHTAAVHGFLAALTAQAPLLGWEIAQLDPPRRASRHFRHDAGMRAVNPDAFGVLHQGRHDAGPSSWSGSEGPCGPPPCRSASPPICATTHLTGPPTTTAYAALRPSRLRRRDRPDPLPARGAGGDAGRGGDGPPVGLPQEGRGRPGAAGTRLGRPRRAGSAPGPADPMNDEE